MMISTVGRGFLCSDDTLLIVILQPYINRLFGHYGRNGMFVNELLVSLFEKHSEIVKALDYPPQSHAVCKENYHRYPVFAHLIEKQLLQIVGFVVGHYLSFRGNRPAAGMTAGFNKGIPGVPKNNTPLLT